MTSTTIDPVADALVEVINDLTTTISVTGVKWDPGMAGLDYLPAGVVGMPTINRTGLLEPEDHISQVDWDIEFPVVFVFDLAEAVQAQAQAVETIEAFIKAVDADTTLGQSDYSGGVTQETKVTEAGPPEVFDDEARPTIAYRCRVLVKQFV